MGLFVDSAQVLLFRILISVRYIFPNESSDNQLFHIILHRETIYDTMILTQSFMIHAVGIILLIFHHLEFRSNLQSQTLFMDYINYHM